MLKEGVLHFDVDARHVHQLGEELVADRITALSELIKNSYDADAATVQIEFQNCDAPGGSLVVRDDGLGMRLTDVEQAWMRIATTHKERKPFSDKYKRARQGRKGIGRFAAETLGDQLILQSTRAGEEVEVVFDWKTQFRAGLDLSKIENKYSVTPADKQAHGTRLFINGLRHRWSESDVQNLSRAVLLLQPPFRRRPKKAKGSDPGFRVKIHVNDRDASSEKVPIDEFLAGATAVLDGRVTADGRAYWRLSSTLLGLKERQEPDHSPKIGPISFRVYYFVYRRDAIGDVSVQLAQQMGNRYGGVRLYRDNMRILPYGDQGDDWLGLDDLYRKRTILPPIANPNWFGQVFFSRENNPDLIDTSSREGLVENDAFDQMRGFIQKGLIWGVYRVAALRDRKQRAGSRPLVAARRVTGRADIVRSLLEEAENLLRQAGSYDRSTKTVLRSLSVQVVEAQRQDRAEQDLREQLLGELELLRVLASLGTSIAVFSHEVRAVLNTAMGVVYDLKKRLPLTAQTDGRISEVEDGLERLSELAQFIDAFGSRTRRREKKAQPVTRITNDFVQAFDPLLKRRGISVEMHVRPTHLRTSKMARSELESILINLLTNSVKALDSARIKDKRIRLDAKADGRWATIRFQDTGVGVPKSIADRIFDPFITTTTGSDPALGLGTGLGLKIVRDIIEAAGGRVDLAEPSKGFSTCVQFSLPKATS